MIILLVQWNPEQFLLHKYLWNAILIHISSNNMESGSGVCGDDKHFNEYEENPFCIESSHPQQFESTSFEDSAKEDTEEEDGEGDF